MRFTIQREAFLKPLKAVAGVVERRHMQTLPVLSNVLIRVQGSHLALTTTDQEVELIAEATLEEEGVSGLVTVPVRKLMDICRALPEGVLLTVLEENDRIIIRAGRGRFVLSTLPANEFPSLNQEIGDFQFVVPKKALKLLIEQIAFAMAEQDVRYYLNGMLIEVKKGEIAAVAADGHRLAFGKMAATSVNSKETMRVIIPRKGILELQRVLDDTEEEMVIILGSNHIQVKTGLVTLTSKLLDNRFPDYERIIPTNGSKIVVGNRELLRDGFQRAAALFNDKVRAVRLRLETGCLKISATNTDQDEAEEDLEVDYVGDELEIGFNVKYLIDFLNVIQTEAVKFTFSDSNSSARVESTNGEGGVYVIMPMRI